MPIYNEIFDSFRANNKKLEEAIKLLEENGFIVYDKEKKYVPSK
jgi:ribosomal protein S18 acetylase RimI-like enzyme